MPWCDACSKFLTPTSMSPEGACPTCGRTIEVDAVRDGKHLDLRQLTTDDESVPWHFKLMLVALALYLGWRLVQVVLLLFN